MSPLGIERCSCRGFRISYWSSAISFLCTTVAPTFHIHLTAMAKIKTRGLPVFLLHFEGAPFVERFYLALPNIEAHNGHLRTPLGIAVAHLSHAVCARLPCGKDPRVCVHCDWALLSVRGNQKAAESWWVKTGKSSWGRHDAIFMILYDTWIIMLHEEERKDHPLLEGFLAN